MLFNCLAFAALFCLDEPAAAPSVSSVVFFGDEELFNTLPCRSDRPKKAMQAVKRSDNGTALTDLARQRQVFSRTSLLGSD